MLMDDPSHGLTEGTIAASPEGGPVGIIKAQDEQTTLPCG